MELHRVDRICMSVLSKDPPTFMQFLLEEDFKLGTRDVPYPNDAVLEVSA